MINSHIKYHSRLTNASWCNLYHLNLQTSDFIVFNPGCRVHHHSVYSVNWSKFVGWSLVVLGSSPCPLQTYTWHHVHCAAGFWSTKAVVCRHGQNTGQFAAKFYCHPKTVCFVPFFFWNAKPIDSTNFRDTDGLWEFIGSLPLQRPFELRVQHSPNDLTASGRLQHFYPRKAITKLCSICACNSGWIWFGTQRAGWFENSSMGPNRTERYTTVHGNVSSNN